MLIPFGVLSAAGAGVGVAGDYELIATEILTTSEASITFSNLGDYSATYKHLQIRWAAREVRAADFGEFWIRLNGDSGNNYSRHRLRGDGSSVSSGASASIDKLIVPAVGTNTANYYHAAVVDFLDAYSTTKNTTMRALGGRSISGSAAIDLNSGAYFNTASITSITIIGEIGNVASGSRFSLYGIKA